MRQDHYALAVLGTLLVVGSAADAAFAQKQGGILKVPHFDSPASMSLLEESTVAVNRPMMGVFNNLVLYKQDVPQNSLKSIVPKLGTSWAWNEESLAVNGLPSCHLTLWHRGRVSSVLFFPRGAVCRSPALKGLTLMVNSIYNGQRFEDLWLDK